MIARRMTGLYQDARSGRSSLFDRIADRAGDRRPSFRKLNPRTLVTTR